MISSKQYSTGEINDYIFSLFPHTGDKNIHEGEECYLSDILNGEVLDHNPKIYKALFECLDKSDLTKGWTPVHTIHLFHGKKDMILSYANAEAVMEAFPDKATFKNAPLGSEGHIAACVNWMSTITFGCW